MVVYAVQRSLPIQNLVKLRPNFTGGVVSAKRKYSIDLNFSSRNAPRAHALRELLFKANDLQRPCKQPRQWPTRVPIPVLNRKMAAKAGYLKKIKLALLPQF